MIVNETLSNQTANTPIIVPLTPLNRIPLYIYALRYLCPHFIIALIHPHIRAPKVNKCWSRCIVLPFL